MESFALSNGGALALHCITLGATITSLWAPDRSGRQGDVTLGHDSLEGYLAASPYFGAVVGRYANRIAYGRVMLDGDTWQLSVNDGPHHLHGGLRGFDKVVWEAEPFDGDGGVGVRFSYQSADGEEGYPGALHARVTYRLTDADELRCEYLASTTRPTPVNLTQHSYWNLSAGHSPAILDHELTIHADAFTPVDDGLIPTGDQRLVHGTPFDFRQPRRIGACIDDDDQQLRRAGGYDHNYVLRRPATATMHPAARLHDPLTGRTLSISTSEPGLQLYSGNFLDGTIRGKDGRQYVHRAGLCLETQHFPDSPNRPEFPSTIVRPGARHESTTVFRFSVER